MSDGLAVEAQPLHLPAPDVRALFRLFGPSLGLWRGAEIAALRGVALEPPIVDLGCGDGLVTSFVRSDVDVALDPDRHALHQAETRGIYRRLISLPAEEMPLAGASVGTVLSNSVLEHLPHLTPVLQAISRVLRPGGKLVFTTPTAAFAHQLALPLDRYAAWRNRTLAHLNLLPASAWTRRLAEVGLEVEAVRPYLRPTLVRLWDALEMMQQLWVGRQRLFSLVWRNLPPSILNVLADQTARLDLSSPSPGGGHLIVARKV